MVALLPAWPLTAARAECRSSASGTRSIDVRLSQASGYLCLSLVRLFDGASCGPGSALFSATFGCSETDRMVVTDRGRLVSLLAPRASRREWDIVRIFEPDGDHMIVRAVRLADLPGLAPAIRRPRLALDASGLRVLVEPQLFVPLSTLETLGSVGVRRSAHSR